MLRRLQEGEKTTDAGIIIAESQKRSTLGEVVSIGSKVEDLNVGDQVIFTNFAMDVEALGAEFALVREEEVYGVVEA
jgi:co-chaperonin GroES (HSP10)